MDSGQWVTGEACSVPRPAQYGEEFLVILAEIVILEQEPLGSCEMVAHLGQKILSSCKKSHPYNSLYIFF